MIRYSVHVRCECRGQDGTVLGSNCPKLWRADKSWNPRHGSAGYAMRLPPDGTRLKRDGFPTKAAASAAAERVKDLLALAGDDVDLARQITALVMKATQRGGAVPEPAEVKARLAVGGPLSVAGVTFGQGWREWLDGKKKLRPSAKHTLESNGRNWLLPVLEDVPLHRLSASHVTAVFTRIEKLNAVIAARRAAGDRSFTPVEGDVRTRPRLVGTRTQHHIFAALREYLNYELKRTRRLTFNPVFAVELATPEDHEASVWGPEEVETFLAYAEKHKPRLAIGFRLALKFGLRRGEIAGQRLDGIGDDIAVRDSSVIVGPEVITGQPKSRAGLRRIPVDADPDMPAALRRHRKRQAADRLAAGAAWTETGLLITTATGEAINPDQLTYWFGSLSRKAGLPVIKLHEGRHTANSLWREAGIDTRVRQDWLGHSTPTLTDITYNHVRPAAHDAAAVLAARFWKSGSGTDVT